MGSWNHTCFLSNLAVLDGEEVSLITLVRTDPDMGSCRPIERYYPAPVMIYGEYDSYGGLEKCHGSEIEYLLQEFRDNNIIDDNLTIEEFTRKGDQGELYFADQHTFSKALQGDKNPHIPVEHVVIKKNILNHFLNRYYFTNYHITDKNGKYTLINYEYLCNSIPAYIAKLKEYYHNENNKTYSHMLLRLHYDPVPQPDWPSDDILGQWMASFAKDIAHTFFRKSYTNRLHTLIENNNDDELTCCLQEFCKYILIYSYMNDSRRIFIRPQCSSQESDPRAQVLMSNITLDVAKEEQAQRELEDFPEDAWDPIREVFIEQCEIEF